MSEKLEKGTQSIEDLNKDLFAIELAEDFDTKRSFVENLKVLLENLDQLSPEERAELFERLNSQEYQDLLNKLNSDEFRDLLINDLSELYSVYEIEAVFDSIRKYFSGESLSNSQDESVAPSSQGEVAGDASDNSGDNDDGSDVNNTEESKTEYEQLTEAEEPEGETQTEEEPVAEAVEPEGETLTEEEPVAEAVDPEGEIQTEEDFEQGLDIELDEFDDFFEQGENYTPDIRSETINDHVFTNDQADVVIEKEEAEQKASNKNLNAQPPEEKEILSEATEKGGETQTLDNENKLSDTDLKPSDASSGQETEKEIKASVSDEKPIDAEGLKAAKVDETQEQPAPQPNLQQPALQPNLQPAFNVHQVPSQSNVPAQSAAPMVEDPMANQMGLVVYVWRKLFNNPEYIKPVTPAREQDPSNPSNSRFNEADLPTVADMQNKRQAAEQKKSGLFALRGELATLREEVDALRNAIASPETTFTKIDPDLEELNAALDRQPEHIKNGINMRWGDDDSKKTNVASQSFSEDEPTNLSSDQTQAKAKADQTSNKTQHEDVAVTAPTIVDATFVEVESNITTPVTEPEQISPAKALIGELVLRDTPMMDMDIALSKVTGLVPVNPDFDLSAKDSLTFKDTNSPTLSKELFLESKSFPFDYKSKSFDKDVQRDIATKVNTPSEAQELASELNSQTKNSKSWFQEFLDIAARGNPKMAIYRELYNTVKEEETRQEAIKTASDKLQEKGLHMEFSKDGEASFNKDLEEAKEGAKENTSILQEAKELLSSAIKRLQNAVAYSMFLDDEKPKTSSPKMKA